MLSDKSWTVTYPLLCSVVELFICCMFRGHEKVDTCFIASYPEKIHEYTPQDWSKLNDNERWVLLSEGETVKEILETGFCLRTRGTSIGKCCMLPWLKEANWSEHKLLCSQPPQLRKNRLSPQQLLEKALLEMSVGELRSGLAVWTVYCKLKSKHWSTPS